jgi:hypothetical protein
MTQTAGSPPTIKFRCARCRRLLRVPGESLGNNARCPECQQLMQIPTPRPGLPWERGPRNLSTLIATALRVSFRPNLAFSEMKQHGRLRTPLVYSALCYFVGIFAMVTWDTILTLGYLYSIGGTAPELQNMALSMGTVLACYLLVGVPLMATLGNVMHAGILHICLIISGGSPRPFETSFRIACYTQPSLMWLAFFPFGMLAASIGTIVLSVFAVHKAHEVSLGRAVLAVALLVVVVFIILVIGAVLFLSGIAWMAMQG